MKRLNYIGQFIFEAQLLEIACHSIWKIDNQQMTQGYKDVGELDNSSLFLIPELR